MKYILKPKKFLCLILALCFVIGLFPASFAQTTTQEVDYMTRNNWIRSSSQTVKNSMSYFRRDFNLAALPVSLSVKTSAHNHLKFYVNSNLVTGYVSPAPAALPENINYLSYEFSGATLSSLLGASPTQLCLAAAVQYMGNSGTNYINATPAFWCEVKVTYGNGATEILKTDTTWRALSDTPYANNTPSMSSRKMNAQLDYDARKMPDGLAWTRYGYNESSYTQGTWKAAVAADGSTASWKMRRQNIPEGAVHQEITPTPIPKQEAGWQVFDTGRIVSGWVKIRASAPQGTRICIRYSEYLDGDKVHYGVGSLNQKSENYCDWYTFSGNGVETFVSDFDYKAFRYFEVIGLPGMIGPESVTVQWASTEMEQTATFSSSDEFLTKLYQAAINTQINNVIGMPVDCPHREQAQYLADSQLQYALLSYAFEEYPALCYKTLFDFASSQKGSGRFSYTAPTEAYADMLSIPEWDLRYADILHTWLQYSGDTASASVFYNAACRNTNYYLNRRNAKGLLPDDPDAWNISDHPAGEKGVKHVPDNPGANTVAPTVVNILLFDSANKLSQVATLLGKTEEARTWAEKAEEVRRSINQYLFHKTSGLYYIHSGSTTTNTGVTAMAINTGVALPYYLKRQIASLSAGTVDTSVVLTFELFRAVMEHGTAAQKESVYKRMQTSWGPMIEKGYQTVWENFLDQSSHTHAWSGYPAYFMLKDFLGVEFEGMGKNKIAIRPFLPAQVNNIQGKVEIPGTDSAIGVSLKQENETYLSVTLPQTGDWVEVAVPRTTGQSTLVTLNGVTVFAKGTGLDTTGAKYLKNDVNYVYFNVKGAGTYHFISQREPSQNGTVTLTLQCQGGGKIQMNGKDVPLNHTVNVFTKDSVSLKAIAEKGYVFVGWTGSISSDSAILTFQPDADTLLTPIFEKREGQVIPEATYKPTSTSTTTTTTKKPGQSTSTSTEADITTSSRGEKEEIDTTVSALPEKRDTGLVIFLVIALILLLSGGCTVLLLLLAKKKKSQGAKANAPAKSEDLKEKNETPKKE